MKLTRSASTQKIVTSVPSSIAPAKLPQKHFTGQFAKQGSQGRSSVSGHTVTVFGATGFLGRYLVQELGKRGSTVVIPYRGSPQDIRHLKVLGDLGQIVNTRVDVRDEESVRECVRHSDTVYNLVGRDYETRNFNFEQVHVDAARTLAKISKEEGVKRFIHVSALNADSESKSQYFKTKALGEVAVAQEFEDSIIVRPASMYGWEDRLLHLLGATVTHKLKRYVTAGYIPMIDGGHRKFAPVYVGDVARALYNIIEMDTPCQVYELAGPDTFSYYDFVKMFCEFTRRPFFPLTVPYSAARSIVSLTQNSPIARITTHDIDRILISDKLHPDSGRFGDLDIDPEKIEDIIIRFVRQFRSNAHIEEPGDLSDVKYWQRINDKE